MNSTLLFSIEILKIYRKQIERSCQPKRHVKQMEKAEVKFKPIAVHVEMVCFYKYFRLHIL